MSDEKNGQQIDTIERGEQEERKVADESGEPTKDDE